MTLLWKKAYLAKRIFPEELAEKAVAIRRAGHTIATLNGSFDLLHAGHLEIIYQAAQQADCLIVALNSDASIAQYKGASRPLIPLEARLQLVAALEFVSYVTHFDALDPRSLLAQINPDVHVNGAEYGDQCIEAETVRSHGGRLHLVDLVPGLSTTKIIDKITESL
ncbi:MAG: adenylyltransferase/cytidyltransferase family protein [Chlamydiota bacterium]